MQVAHPQSQSPQHAKIFKDHATTKPTRKLQEHDFRDEETTANNARVHVQRIMPPQKKKNKRQKSRAKAKSFRARRSTQNSTTNASIASECNRWCKRKFEAKARKQKNARKSKHAKAVRKRTQAKVQKQWGARKEDRIFSQAIPLRTEVNFQFKGMGGGCISATGNFLLTVKVGEHPRDCRFVFLEKH